MTLSQPTRALDQLGVEKPAREIFDKARDVFGVSSDARAVHIGDTFQKYASL